MKRLTTVSSQRDWEPVPDNSKARLSFFLVFGFRPKILRYCILQKPAPICCYMLLSVPLKSLCARRTCTPPLEAITFTSRIFLPVIRIALLHTLATDLPRLRLMVALRRRFLMPRIPLFLLRRDMATAMAVNHARHDKPAKQ